jgi:hypothetical protein
MTAFGADVLRLTVDLLPLLLAFALVRLARSAAHAALVVLNLWLFMELLTALVDPATGSARCCCRACWRAACRSGSRSRACCCGGSGAPGRRA